MSSSTVINFPFSPSAPLPPLAAKVAPKRSLWRTWNQLSRFQRSLTYMFLGVLFFLALYFYLGSTAVSDAPGGEFVKSREEEVQRPNSNEEQQPPPEEKPPEPKNRVELVHNALLDEESRNQAKEEDDFDEQKEEDDQPEKNGENDARENFVEEAEKDKAAAKKHGEVLPPKDRSIKFTGPQNERQQAVVDAMKHAWKGYKAHAWGHDHLKPISKAAQNWFGLGLTLVDSLDTLYIMNLQHEFNEAKEWVAKDLSFTVNKDVNLFETTIRVLGGLLSAFHLSGENVFLEKAKDLGERLLGAFTSPSGIPYSDVNLRSTVGHAPRWSTDSSTSEVATIQLEFRDLSRATGDTTFEEKAEHVSRLIHDMPKSDGLVPIYINANTGKFRPQSTITLGARGDSYYEYLLKQWIQTGKTLNYLKQDFVDAIEGVNHRLVQRTVPNNLLFVGEILSGGKTFKPKMDELVCFLPGTLALGVHHGLPKSHMLLAQELAYTCYLTFARQPTFLAAEINYFNTEPASSTDFYVKPADSHYLLRPETIESLWYLYYFTGNKTYQEWGWKIFQGIEKYTKVTNGYTTIGNVKNPLDLRPKDMMESFLLGETFKYLYLLFADKQEIDLNQWVFNTEAHPLPIFPN